SGRSAAPRPLASAEWARRSSGSPKSASRGEAAPTTFRVQCPLADLSLYDLSLNEYSCNCSMSSAFSCASKSLGPGANESRICGQIRFGEGPIGDIALPRSQKQE